MSVERTSKNKASHWIGRTAWGSLVVVAIWLFLGLLSPDVLMPFSDEVQMSGQVKSLEDEGKIYRGMSAEELLREIGEPTSRDKDGPERIIFQWDCGGTFFGHYWFSAHIEEGKVSSFSMTR